MASSSASAAGGARRRAALAAAVAVMAAVAAACSTAPARLPPPGPDAAQAWAERRLLLERIEEWSLAGRMTVDNGADAWSGQLWWRQNPASYTIALRSPFGQQVARLQGGDGGVTLYAPDREPLSAADPGELLAGYIGWPVPVAGLRSWVRGLPDGDGAAERSWDGAGRLTSLDQAGWHIEFQRYAAVAGVELPTKILLIHPRLRVRMVIDRWDIGGAPGGAR